MRFPGPGGRTRHHDNRGNFQPHGKDSADAQSVAPRRFLLLFMELTLKSPSPGSRAWAQMLVRVETGGSGSLGPAHCKRPKDKQVPLWSGNLRAPIFPGASFS